MTTSALSLVLTRAEAAALCGLSPSGFDSWVKRGIVPGPIAGTKRWSRAAIVRAVGGGPAGQEGGTGDDGLSPFERWERDNASAPHRHQQRHG